MNKEEFETLKNRLRYIYENEGNEVAGKVGGLKVTVSTTMTAFTNKYIEKEARKFEDDCVLEWPDDENEKLNTFYNKKFLITWGSIYNVCDYIKQYDKKFYNKYRLLINE